jgi:ATP-dependent DNA helicase RecQ
VNTQIVQPEDWLGAFGLDGFRPGQKNVIEAILSGRDTLCIMPTGGGKSLCFQLPTLARDGVTIVISPLIALMKDQVDSLQKIGIPATFINSSLSHEEQQSRIGAMVKGDYKLVYIAPERLRSNSFKRAVQKSNIQLLAVDEAHCISQWGHDFRPDYARLGRLRKLLGNPQTVALTATATTMVQEDIAKILELEEPAKFVTGFARSNLNLRVTSPGSNTEKDQKLIRFLKSHPGCGIIYASTRKNCEQLIEFLQDDLSRTVAVYHAGLTPESRRHVQEQFMSGEIEIIVATNAFGMGIDKSDLRFVVHYNLPGSIEAYYQEAGRAGRDGKPSECLMLYSFQDKFIQEFFIENSYPSRETIKQVYEYLRSIKTDPIEVTLQEIKEELGISTGTGGIGNCENLLEKAGAIERLDSRQNSAAIRIDSELPTLIDFLPRDARTQRHVLRALEQVVGSFRGERILFQPKRFADRLDMKWEAVNRAIKQLVKLPMIDYIPPFRGRAIHVVDRSLKFAQLDIDFGELKRRQKAEVEKLNSVIRFATSRRCRQLEILEYFGDPDRQLCANCDNCDENPVAALTQSVLDVSERTPASDACLYAAQVALSGTARTKGRVGKTMIAQMLSGSTSQKVKRYAKLPTYGLLSRLRQSDVVSLMEFLIQQGYIQQNEEVKFRPIAAISPTGTRLMKGQMYVDVSQQMPKALGKKIARHLNGKQPHLVVPAEPDEPIEIQPDHPTSSEQENESQADNIEVEQEQEEIKEEPGEEIEGATGVNDESAAVELDNFEEDEFEDDEPEEDELEHDDLNSDGYRLEADLPDVDEIENGFQDELEDEFFEEEPESEFETTSNQETSPGNDPLPPEHSTAPTTSSKEPLTPEATSTSSTPTHPRSLFDFDHESKSHPQSQNSEASSSHPPSDKRFRADPPSEGVVQPTFYWTWKLLTEGYTREQLTQVRKIDQATVFDHAIQAGENGLPLEASWLLDQETISELENFVANHPSERPSNLLAKLPPHLKAQYLMYFVKCRKTHSS